MFIYKTHKPSLPECNACGRGEGRGLTHLRPQEYQEGRDLDRAGRTHWRCLNTESSSG